MRQVGPRPSDRSARNGSKGSVSGLFAGIGGLELGLERVGFETAELCEIDPHAQQVLQTRFPKAKIDNDVTTLAALPPVDIVTAGFPCQDLSMAGRKVGISGSRSGLVDSLFRLLRQARAAHQDPHWIVIENVPYMLHLDRGAAMRYVVTQLEELGYHWAYRVVDARAFGVPQRRLRVLLVGSRQSDPRPVLLSGNVVPDVDDATSRSDDSLAYGFYWTEGKRGLGWTVDGVPTIKGGSALGIPSAPAVWIRATGEIGTPDIRDLERLQGLPDGWTEPAEVPSDRASRGARWRLVGNAVCANVSEWLGQRLLEPTGDVPVGRPLTERERWPNAGFGGPGMPRAAVSVSTWPTSRLRSPLRSFMHHPLIPLSARATRGYLGRAAAATTLNFPPGFLEALERHAAKMERLQATALMAEMPVAVGR